jgi:pyridoxine/pyridoxamine 5'-phosphate oxidase
MENQKSLQQVGSQQVKNNMQYLLTELQDKMQNQNMDVMQSVSDLVTEGNNPQEVAMALMQIGYDENTIKQIFQKIQASQPQEEEQEIKEVATQQEASAQQPQSQQERVQQLQQEGMTAKKGKQVKAKKGMSFKDWMRGAIGFNQNINQYQGYDTPEARYLPMKPQNTTIGAIQGMASDTLDFIDSMKKENRPGKESFYKYKVNMPKAYNGQELALNEKELYRSATENKPIRTIQELIDETKRRSSLNYDPNMGYVSSIANPYASQKEIDKMMLKKFGPGYKDRGTSYKSLDNPYMFDLGSLEAIQDYMKGMSSGDIPRGTTLQVDDAGMPIYVTGENVDYDLMLGRKKLATTEGLVEKAKKEMAEKAKKKEASKSDTDTNPKKQLGGNTHNTHHAQDGVQLPGMKSHTDFYQPEEEKIRSIRVGYNDAIPPSQITTEGLNLNPEFYSIDDLGEPQEKQRATASIQNKAWGDFLRGMNTFGDISNYAVNIARNANTILENADYQRQYANTFYDKDASKIYGTDDPSKGFFTYQQEGILQPNQQTEYISQKGREMKNYNDYFMMQYGGLPKAQYENSQVKSDNTRVNQISEADIQAYVNMMNTARNEETLFKFFPQLKNMKKMPVRDPALQDRDTNVVIKDGIAYYPKYATGYVEGEEGSEDNRGVVKDYLDPKWKGKRSTIPYFEVGSDPQSISMMRKLKTMNIPFDFGNALPKGYMDVGEYLQNISPVGEKMQMGGMNPMSEFFMDNELPIYKKKGQVPRSFPENPFYKMYGGTSNPFSQKKNLVKKMGGQTANISTEVLKRLMEKTKGKFKYNTL